MSGKKYDSIVLASNLGFMAQVVRRRTSRGTTVEDSRDGFKTQAEAAAWGAQALAAYLARRESRRVARRESKKRGRARRAEEAEWLRQQTYKSLVECVESGVPRAKAANAEFKGRAESLLGEIAFRAFQGGTPRKQAIALAREHIGRNWTERRQKALLGILDALDKGVCDMAVANAGRILNTALVFQELNGGKPADHA